MKKKIKNAFKRVKNIITNPKRYFTKIVADGNMEESMLRAFYMVCLVVVWFYLFV